MNSFALLVTRLSNQDLLRGDGRCLLMCAQEDPYFGRGFEDLPITNCNEENNLNFVLLNHANFNLVIFPGSKMLANWTTEKGNMNTEQIQYQDGMIHLGFWNQVDSYWSHLLQLLSNRPETPVVFAGHSRGGACAVISALRFFTEQENVGVPAIVTLGQPMCVDSIIGKRMDEIWRDKYVRVVTSTDIVPLGPPNILRYSHAGTLWFYDKSGHCVINPSQNIMKKAIWRDNPILGRKGYLTMLPFLFSLYWPWLILFVVQVQGPRHIEGHKLSYYCDVIQGHIERYSYVVVNFRDELVKVYIW